MAKREVEFYEFAVGGGPRPYWWRAEYPASMDVVVLVAFQRVGTGVIRLSLVKVQGKPKVAAVGFGLDVRRPGARGRAVCVSPLIGCVSVYDEHVVPQRVRGLDGDSL